MKYRLWLLIGVTIMLSLSSCTEDIIVSNTQLVKCISITGQDFHSGEPDTKAAYTVDGTGMHFSWTEGDTVGIYPVGGDQVAFPISSGEGSQTAQFDGGAWALRSSYSYAAYYPYVKGNYMVDETQIPVSFIGQVQNGNGSLDCLDRFDYQASVATHPDDDGNVNIELKHLGSFVRFQFTMPIADTYKSITLTSIKTPFVTSGTFDLTKNDITITSTSTSPSITMSLNNTATTADDKILTVYAMLAPADLSDSEISISIEGTTYKSYSATITGKNMIAGKAYSYTAKVQSGTNINGSDVEWDDEGNEISHIPSYWISDDKGYHYVDLGLSVKWATCNIGAETPEAYGNYFAWGETVSVNETDYSNLNNFSYSNSYVRSYYTGATYKWSDGISYDHVTKYNNVDNKYQLEASDDAAMVRMGGNWRMPTSAEMQELRESCKWTWATYKGVNGYVVQSNVNNNTIFLPAAGYYYNSTISSTGIVGQYWSSTLESYKSGVYIYAYYINFNKDYYNNTTYGSGSTREIGYPIRPVYDVNMEKHEYVDLGLSVKWATCNVGASKPEEYGDYYAWGETAPKSSYTWTNYIFRISGDSWDNVKNNKYNNSVKYGTVDNKITLAPEDDVANVKWGGSWRMPTKEEQDELRNKCDWKWYKSGNSDFDGVAGYKVTSNVSGYTDRFIFLPAAGGYSNSTEELLLDGVYGYYWSSSLLTDCSRDALYLFIYNNGLYTSNNGRNYGLSVRPVCP